MVPSAMRRRMVLGETPTHSAASAIDSQAGGWVSAVSTRPPSGRFLVSVIGVRSALERDVTDSDAALVGRAKLGTEPLDDGEQEDAGSAAEVRLEVSK